MGVRTWTIVGGLALAIVSAGLPAAAEDKETSVFEMQEVSVFEQDDSDDVQMLSMLRGGQYAPCTFDRHEEVKKYPELKSDPKTTTAKRRPTIA